MHHASQQSLLQFIADFIEQTVHSDSAIGVNLIRSNRNLCI